MIVEVAPKLVGAACAGADPNLFHPEFLGEETRALEYCARCPVVDECAQRAPSCDDTLFPVVYGGRVIVPAQLVKDASIACGTLSGVAQHQRAFQRPCAECRKASFGADVSCGTYGGFLRHQSSSEPPCAECRKARTAWKNWRRKVKRGRTATRHDWVAEMRRRDVVCGSSAGVQRHRKRGEDLCVDCFGWVEMRRRSALWEVK